MTPDWYKLYVEKKLFRYRVHVTVPPRANHLGFVVWARDAIEAKHRVAERGYVVRHVREEQVPV